MPRSVARAWIAGLALGGALLAAEALRPDTDAARSAMIALEEAVPQHVGRWTMRTAPLPEQAAGEVRPAADAAAQQVIARTYVDDAGRWVMLAISYGVDPNGLQGHRPEYCYQGQGFSIDGSRDEQLALGDGRLPVRRLVATRGVRHEPITYWMTVGRKAVRPGLERKLEQLRATLGGRFPEGMVVRVSSLGHNVAEGHALQVEFIQALLGALEPGTRARLAGTAI